MGLHAMMLLTFAESAICIEEIKLHLFVSVYVDSLAYQNESGT